MIEKNLFQINRNAKSMKKIAVFITAHLCLIFLCFSISAQDFKTVKDGIEYAEMTREIDNQSVKMNLLRLDLSKVRLDVVHALDEAIGLETVSSMATRHGAIAAINGGFFRLDKSIFAGGAAGVLMIDGKLISEPRGNRTAILIINNPKQTEIAFRQLNFSAGEIRIKKNVFVFTGINRERKKDDLILFDSDFHRTTLTDQNGVEIMIQAGKVVNILNNRGNSQIPQNGFVLSASGDERERLLQTLKVGTKVKISTPIINLCSEKGNGAVCFTEDATNGAVRLIKDGKIEITWEQENQSKSFVETKHPRTAVAKLKDGKFLMVTIDGRSETSGGIGLQNLAEILLEMGATDAMNLDGGGSTTMFLDGKVVNKPSDKEGERKIGDAILVFPRTRN